jgi:hypothetical protein
MVDPQEPRPKGSMGAFVLAGLLLPVIILLAVRVLG